MAADAWKIYDGFKEFLGEKVIDLNNDSFKCALFLSTSDAATLGIDLFASITNEHANANGYTSGGNAITSPTWTRATATMTFDFVDPVFTASGGSIIARFAVIYDDTPTSPADPNMGFSLLDNLPQDVEVTDTNTLTIQINVNGMFQLSG